MPSPYPRSDERRRMVDLQIAGRGIRDPRVLAAMTEVPRHLFVPPPYDRDAYADTPLPIGNGQTISQPYIVALMTELLHPGPEDRVLEIGAGSGYQAAILARLAAQVVTIERIGAVAAQARSPGSSRTTEGWLPRWAAGRYRISWYGNATAAGSGKSGRRASGSCRSSVSTAGRGKV